MAILVVEDDPDLLEILCFTLRRQGHEVITAPDGETALQFWKTKNPTLVLLDITLPRKNGWDVCREIRQESKIPLIMLTAASREADIVKGFDLGADDYITKPFSHKQLTARVQAILRRSTGQVDELPKELHVMIAGDLKLDPQWRRVSRGEIAIQLTPMEFKLLYELVLHQGQVLPHEVLVERVWGYGDVDSPLLVKGHIRNLRRKLGDDALNPVYIHSSMGIGYTFRPSASSLNHGSMPAQLVDGQLQPTR